MPFTDRTKIILKDDGLEKLSKSSIIIFGVGGVGGYVCEMLARTGVENLTIVDFDNVSESNINRQIIALHSTVGKSKVEVMKARIADINPQAKVKAIVEKLDSDNIDSFNLEKFDYVVDCIDMVKSKVALMDYCFRNTIKLISSMGTGNRKGIPTFKVCDIFSTSFDGLARVLRRELKQIGVKNSTVVCSTEQVLPAKEIGSVVYYPAMCACTLSAYVIEQLTK